MHILQSRSAKDPQLTLVSLDAGAAYDVVSRSAMLVALRANLVASALLPLANLWYLDEFTYAWTAAGATHLVTQAEGGEQGGPLMPGLFSLALARVLRSLQEELRPGEAIFAFLDDTYIAASPDRATHPCGRLEHHLYSHARPRLNTSKTAFGNHTPDGLHVDRTVAALRRSRRRPGHVAARTAQTRCPDWP